MKGKGEEYGNYSSTYEEDVSKGKPETDGINS